MWVRPTSDPSRAIVIDPVTKRRIPPEGIQVPDNHFAYLRMIRMRDLEVFTPAPAVPASSSQKA